MIDDAADNNEFDLVLESPPRPVKRARMDMDALRGALAGVQGERGSHSSSQASSPIIEMGDPCAHDLPNGSCDGDDFEPSATLENDDNTAMEIDEVEMEGLEEPSEAKEVQKVTEDAESSAVINLEKVHDSIIGSDDPAVTITENESPTQSSPHGNGHAIEAAAAAEHDDNAFIGIAQNNDQEKGEDSGDQAEITEYKAFPRQLKVYDRVWLMLFNAERKSALKALSRAEARGKRCYVDELDEEERNDLYENI
jgi:hypothetical protein